ncbi:hypothetical protein F4808DRAFT_40934 [Astrocystis sublimbata]|nr:hypothetical protein F4808DRAFT_40934 [Astrocystis sublimbata]
MTAAATLGEVETKRTRNLALSATGRGRPSLFGLNITDHWRQRDVEVRRDWTAAAASLAGATLPSGRLFRNTRAGIHGAMVQKTPLTQVGTGHWAGSTRSRRMVCESLVFGGARRSPELFQVAPASDREERERGIARCFLASAWLGPLPWPCSAPAWLSGDPGLFLAGCWGVLGGAVGRDVEGRVETLRERLLRAGHDSLLGSLLGRGESLRSAGHSELVRGHGRRYGSKTNHCASARPMSTPPRHDKSARSRSHAHTHSLAHSSQLGARS